MVKHCAFVNCTSDSRYPIKLQNATFHPFPKPTRNLEICQRWVVACASTKLTVDRVKKYTYVCSKHFVGGKSPSLEYPDPMEEKTEFTFQPDEPPDMETGIQIVDVRSQFPDEMQAAPRPLQFEDIRSQFPCPENWSLTICKNELWFGKLRNCSFIMRYIINKDMDTRIEVLQQELHSHKVLEQFPYKIQNLSQLNEILITLDQYNVCQGNVERDLIEAFYTKEKRTGNLNFLSQAVYSLKCELLAKNVRCGKCRIFRYELYSYIKRRQQFHSRIKSGDQIINPKPKVGLSNLKARTILSSCEKENNFEIEKDCNERSIENVTEVVITVSYDQQYTK